MPSDPSLLGFGGRWYGDVVATAESRALPTGRRFKLVTPVMFLATKLDAFDDRGRGDVMPSHDLEDIIAILDGRPEIVDEIAAASSAHRAHLQRAFAALIGERDRLDAIPWHLPGDATSQARAEAVRARILAILQPP